MCYTKSRKNKIAHRFRIRELNRVALLQPVLDAKQDLAIAVPRRSRSMRRLSYSTFVRIRSFTEQYSVEVGPVNSHCVLPLVLSDQNGVIARVSCVYNNLSKFLSTLQLYDEAGVPRLDSITSVLLNGFPIRRSFFSAGPRRSSHLPGPCPTREPPGT